MKIQSIARCIAALAVSFPALCSASGLTPVEDPMVAPSIAAPDLSGAERSLSEFAGKVVVINFWATWCPPCVKELPSMQALWERFHDRDFVLIAVNVGEDRQSVSDFLDAFRTRIDFPVLLDADLAIVKRWPVFGLPTSFVVDGQGNVVYKALGERDWRDESIIAEIRTLLEGSAGADATTGNDVVGR